MSEYNEQVLVIAWSNTQLHRYPQLKWLHSSLNGVRLSFGLARKAKNSGLKKGIADLFLPVRNMFYSGLYIEMKWEKNKQSIEQKDFQTFVECQGYKYVLCYSAEKAIKEIQAYMAYVQSNKEVVSVHPNTITT